MATRTVTETICDLCQTSLDSRGPHLQLVVTPVNGVVLPASRLDVCVTCLATFPVPIRQLLETNLPMLGTYDTTP